VFDVCVHIVSSTRCTVYVVLAAGFIVDLNRPSTVPVAARSAAARMLELGVRISPGHGCLF